MLLMNKWNQETCVFGVVFGVSRYERAPRRFRPVVRWRVRTKPTDTETMNTSTNYYIGIDAHKRFSQVHVLAEDGSTA